MGVCLKMDDLDIDSIIGKTALHRRTSGGSMINVIKSKDTNDHEIYNEALFDLIYRRTEGAKSDMARELGIQRFPEEAELELLREGVVGEDLKSLNNMIKMMIKLKPEDKSEFKKRHASKVSEEKKA